MELPSIYSATLGLAHPWNVTSVEFADDMKRLDITVVYIANDSLSCKCGSGVQWLWTALETWHHDDFFRFNTYLHARVPRFTCSACGGSEVEKPWSRKGSRFSLTSPAD